MLNRATKIRAADDIKAHQLRLDVRKEELSDTSFYQISTPPPPLLQLPSMTKTLEK